MCVILNFFFLKHTYLPTHPEKCGQKYIKGKNSNDNPSMSIS